MINYTGLRNRDSYNEIINYIQTDQPIVKYPNRKASFFIKYPAILIIIRIRWNG